MYLFSFCIIDSRRFSVISIYAVSVIACMQSQERGREKKFDECVSSKTALLVLHHSVPSSYPTRVWPLTSNTPWTSHRTTEKTLELFNSLQNNMVGNDVQCRALVCTAVHSCKFHWAEAVGVRSPLSFVHLITKWARLNSIDSIIQLERVSVIFLGMRKLNEDTATYSSCSGCTQS